MKYTDIMITEIAPAKNIENMIYTIVLSIISSGKSEFNTKGLISEIKKRTGIDVPYNVLMDILTNMPVVQHADDNTVHLGSNEEESNNAESSEDIVSDMASKAASATKD